MFDKKYYKVPLYEVTNFFTGMYHQVDEVIVHKTLLGEMKEFLTGNNINVLPNSCVTIDHCIDYQSFTKELLTGNHVNLLSDTCVPANHYIDSRYLSTLDQLNYGFQIFVFQDDYAKKKLATASDIAAYVDGYNQSKWRFLYESMEYFDSKPKQKMKHMVQK